MRRKRKQNGENGTIDETGTVIQGNKKRKWKKKKVGNNNLEVDNTNTEEVRINEVGTGTETGTALLCQEKKKRKRKRKRTKRKGTDNMVPSNRTNGETTVILPKDLVPNSTVKYLPKELVPEIRKNKLLVLDINGLLADINHSSHSQFSRDADTIIKGKLVFRRPFCLEFLDFCFQNFKVGIWSSKFKSNVKEAVDFLMGNKKSNLLFCWDQSNCTPTNFKTADNPRKPLVFKELWKLWEKVSTDLPWEKGEFGPTNTLLIDDSPYKAFCNPPHTAIFPESYSFENKEDNSLGKGGDLRVYLENLLQTENVQSFLKDNPFGQPAISDSDPSWKYYNQIKNALP